MPDPTPPARFAWLRGQVGAWVAEGIVDEEQAGRILARYRPGRRVALVTLLLVAGACFVGVGALWLVAANLERLSPAARLALLTPVWLAALVAGERLARRGRPHVAGPVRLLAALLAGGVVVQGAQALGVSTEEPWLLACWAAVALAHAYGARAVPPLLVGLLAGTGYAFGATFEAELPVAAVVLVLTAVGVGALALAALHDGPLPRFAPAWRVVGAAVLLVTLTGAAVPGVDERAGSVPVGLLIVVVVVAAVPVVAALAVATPLARTEVLVGLLVVGAALLLVEWTAGEFAASDPSPADVTRAVVGLLACVAASIGAAVAGTLRESGLLVAVGATALLVATTMQALTVFAPVLEGAWLFLAVGAALLATGALFERTRRTVAAPR